MNDLLKLEDARNYPGARSENPMITIRNTFHGTHYRARPQRGIRLAPRTVRRIRRALCGIDGCTCGGDLSERGDITDSDGDLCETHIKPDGSVLLWYV